MYESGKWEGFSTVIAVLGAAILANAPTVGYNVVPVQSCIINPYLGELFEMTWGDEFMYGDEGA